MAPHPGPGQDPCSVCGNRVHPGWVAFLCMVCDQWFHCRCSGIHSQADYLRLAPWSCPTCSTPVPPATPTKEPESSDLERTRSTLSSGDSLSHRSLSIGPSSPPAQTSTAVPGRALERGRFLQFNCNGILHCHAELQYFLHPHQVLVACVQETKLGVNSSLKEFTDYATVRRDRPTGGGGGGLVTLIHHSVPYRVPDSGILPDDDMAKVQTVETFLGGTTLTFVNVHIPPASSWPRNYAPDFDALLENRGDQMVLGDFNTHHPS